MWKSRIAVTTILALVAAGLVAVSVFTVADPGGKQARDWPMPDLSVDTPAAAGTSVTIGIENPDSTSEEWYRHCRYLKLGNPIGRLSEVHVTARPIGPMESETLTITGLTQGAKYRFTCYLDTERGRIQGASTSDSIEATP